MLCAVCEIFHLVGGNVNPGLNRCEGVIIITMSGRVGGGLGEQERFIQPMSIQNLLSVGKS